MQAVMTISLDIAKPLFQVHGIDTQGSGQPQYQPSTTAAASRRIGEAIFERDRPRSKSIAPRGFFWLQAVTPAQHRR